MTDDNQVLFTINVMLNHIYAYRVWKWAIVREEITSTSNIYKLSKNAVHIIKIQNADKEYKATPLPFSLADD
jgi:membrane protein YdbS with pleckstrin-like domain